MPPLHAAAAAAAGGLCALLVAWGAGLNAPMSAKALAAARAVEAREPARLPGLPRGWSAAVARRARRRRRVQQQQQQEQQEGRGRGGGAAWDDESDDGTGGSGDELSGAEEAGGLGDGLGGGWGGGGAGVRGGGPVFVYDLVPSATFLRTFLLREIRAPPSPSPDGASGGCMGCRKPFSDVRWRHHCRLCARTLCSACSSLRAPAALFPAAFDNLDSSSSSSSLALTLAVMPSSAGASERVCGDCHAVLCQPATDPR